MKSPKMKLFAVLTALFLMLGVLPGLAEGTAPAVPTLQVDIKAELSPSLTSLIPPFLLQDKETGATDKGMAALNTLIAAINKLGVSMVSGPEGVSGNVGTEKGSLFDFQAGFNKEKTELFATSNLVPGIALMPSPQMMAQLQAQMVQAQISPEQTLKLAQPYFMAFSEVMAKHQAEAKAEEGTFEIAGYGSFTKRTQMDLTSYMLAELMDKVAETYKNDKALQTVFEQAAKAGQNIGEAGELPEDPVKTMHKAAQEIRDQDNKVLLKTNLYEGASGMYLDAVSPEGDKQPAKIDLLLQPANLQPGQNPVGSIKLKMIATALSMDETEEVKTPDWVAKEEEIKSGKNYRDTLINFSMDVSQEAELQKALMNLNMVAEGMMIGIKADSSSNPQTFENTSVIEVSFMMPQPMLKITVTAKPTQEQPAAPQVDGSTIIKLTDDKLSEEDDAALKASVMKSLPEMMQRLNQVLPEEAPTLMEMLNESMAQPEDLPEPSTEQPNP